MTLRSLTTNRRNRNWQRIQKCHLAAVFTLVLAFCPVAKVAAASSKASEGLQLYSQIHQVLVHPRCMNCHPRGDSPRQGDEAYLHVPPVTRGSKDSGAAGLHCNACHQAENYLPSGVPGAPTWHLAPRSMAWEGKSAGEICRQMLDPRRNGGKSPAQIVEHLTDDKLVAWGWDPGADVRGKARTPVPIPKEEFNRIVKGWANAGAPCPD